MAAGSAVRRAIEASHSPTGYNIGLNFGEAAGQTVAHAHLHVIPRYKGDRGDPRGGIRWVLPERARYWEEEGMARLSERDRGPIALAERIFALLDQGAFTTTYKYAVLFGS